ncbi:histidine phosphatase family protein [Caulobacter sp. ErkDOM-E]|uniref:histidine phosphatase family protein n=1 Tax=Caulobacter sp. ErkDOM-E TaxID=3402778 RepID=UPI003AF5CD41
MIRRLIAIALAPVLFASSALAQTVVIVRHGEKVAPNGDPDLSAAGQARAQALAQALSGARVAMVLATPLKRTQQTAEPAAQAAGVAVVPVPFAGGDAAHAQRLADQARTAPADATVLIVGHSNTVANIARALGDTAAQAPSDCEYDQMTVIQLAGAAAPKVVHARYGAPTAAC